MPKRKRSGVEKRAEKQKIQIEKVPSDDKEHITKEEKLEVSENIAWSDSDLLELITRIEKHIPKDDTLSYGSRVEKMDWSNIAFKNHSVKECKQVWAVLLKQIRKFRLLKEIVADMRSWIQSPKPPSAKETVFKHPDKPKQPPNSYMLFIEEKRYEVMSECPELAPNDVARRLGEMFKSLPIKERERYNRMAKVARQEYSEKLANFYSEHPDLIPKKAKRSRKIQFEEKKGPPEKPKTPFQLFVQIESEKADSEETRYALQQKCREGWNEMEDKDKLFWIKWAEEQFNKYVEDLKEYLKIHPEYEPEKIKTVLSKKEKKIRDRYAGKPDKPPHSAYHLFTKMIMESEEIRKINYKEAVNYIGEKWKACSEEEKNEYKTRVEQMWEEYERKLEEYVKTLPPEERDKVEQTGKRKKPESKGQKSRKKVKVVKVQKPELPPTTDYKYFLSVYKGKENPSVVWENMGEDEKQMFGEKLSEMKRDYIAQYEKYLKSLTKEELEKLGESHNDRYDTSESESAVTEDGDDLED